MAGHSKWKNIQHRKGAQDKKRGKVFTKINKEISVAVKTGGGDDPEANPRLRSALQAAKAANMPKDNIERAIKKAMGGDSDNFIETTFECYGPEGVALFVECATDNNTRAVSNIKSYFNKHGGSVGKDGCLQFIFDQKSVFTLETGNVDEDEFTLAMIDAGAEDVEIEDGLINVTAAMQDFGNIQKLISNLKLGPTEGGLQRIPTTTKDIAKDVFLKIQKLIDVIEDDDDDVQQVYHNIEFRDEFLESE